MVRQKINCIWLALTVVLCVFIFIKGQSKLQVQGASVEFPLALGWHEIPHTQIAPLCPSDPAIQANAGCGAVISAWNGGIADTARNRLVLWGGGHHDYFGNELYALDLHTLKMSRLTEPSPVHNVMGCPEAYPDGRPSARHTYNGLAYIPGLDLMFVYGGSKSACGFMSGETWTFDLAKLEWKLMDSHSQDRPAHSPGVIADYDPNSGMVFLSDTASLFSYDPRKNSYLRLAAFSGVDYHLSGVVDPVRKLFFMFGGPGQLWAVDIGPGSKHALQDWARKVTGCDPLLHANSPGLAFDSQTKVIIGWSGGNTLYLFHPDTFTCSSQTYPGGPGPAQQNGTFGRFRYFPELGVFTLVNDWRQNAFLLRLAPVNAVALPSQRGNND